MKGYTKAGPPTLRTVWHLFTPEDRRILHFQLVRGLPEKYANLHMGLLPFVGVSETFVVLTHAITKQPSRRLKELLSKLNDVAFGDDDALVLRLNDAKVLKRFGMHPEHGKPFPWLSADLSRFAPIEPDGVAKVTFRETPCVALQRAGNGWWAVKCDPKHRDRVEEWLIDYCR